MKLQDIRYDLKVKFQAAQLIEESESYHRAKQLTPGSKQQALHNG